MYLAWGSKLRVYLLGGGGVVKLHQRLQACLLLEGGDFVHEAKGAEHQVQHIQGDGHIGLQGQAWGHDWRGIWCSAIAGSRGR